MRIAQLRVKLLASLTLALAAFAQAGEVPSWAGILSEIDDRFPGVESLEVEQLATTLDAPGTLLVDVRSVAEYELGHLPGAVRLTSARAVRSAADEIGATRVVLYCSVGWRSSELAFQLDELPARVFNLRGSIFAWSQADLPMVDADGDTTKSVHPYNEEWGRLLAEPFPD